LYAKAEWQNPGGSVKDRPALRMIQEGIASGQLVAGKVILDATSGNTGIAYAMMGAAMGYSVTLCVPDNVTPERKRILRAYGARARLHQSARRLRRRDPHGAANERRGPRRSTSMRINTTTTSTGDRTTTRPVRKSSGRRDRD
jgi:cysteine synthase B